MMSKLVLTILAIEFKVTSSRASDPTISDIMGDQIKATFGLE